MARNSLYITASYHKGESGYMVSVPGTAMRFFAKKKRGPGSDSRTFGQAGQYRNKMCAEVNLSDGRTEKKQAAVKTLAAKLKKVSDVKLTFKESLAKCLAEHLQLRISNGDFTNPNARLVEIVFDNKVVESATFDVVQKREYGG